MHRFVIACLTVALGWLTSCGGGGEPALPATRAHAEAASPKGKMAMLKLESAAFATSGSIPRKYTCEGDDIAPPLSFRGVPEGTKSLALIVDDPDAPDPAAPKRVWVHWVVYDLPPDTSGLPEGGTLPKNAREGKNDWGRTGYGGPCPPIGRHRYFHRLYALDKQLGDLKQPNKGTLEAAMKGHVIAQTELVGTYQKQGR